MRTRVGEIRRCNLTGLCEIFHDAVSEIGVNGLLRVTVEWESQAEREAYFDKETGEPIRWETLGLLSAGGPAHLLGAWLSARALAMDEASHPGSGGTTSGSYTRAFASLAVASVTAVITGGEYAPWRVQPFLHGAVWQALVAQRAEATSTELWAYAAPTSAMPSHTLHYCPLLSLHKGNC